MPGSLGDCIEYIEKKANVPHRLGIYIYKVRPRDKTAIAGDALVKQRRRSNKRRFATRMFTRRRPAKRRPSKRWRSKKRRPSPKRRRPSSKRRISKRRRPKQGRSPKHPLSIRPRTLINVENVMPETSTRISEKDMPETSTKISEKDMPETTTNKG